ncbi:biotin transport system substrate-specific component [Kineococcus radiotolerans]|uniref:Biotin transporter n=2 Tax=Kineococcus radiotolerans TaxID=131568 RepID=A6WC36_KINRD|nr:biotin transporter BioY [Kineococcus radiotolerans]ABS04375.1 BioY protein [Kineococcus radiotolerans SRS30216 = ATCC BAA-149]MBB2902951.1 biotin transport system substrate-specific component [Kineococcus radiotolerans]
MTPSTRRRPTPPAAGLRRPVERSGDLALVAVFAALVCALALTPGIPIGLLAIPITLQTLGIMLCGAVLGPWRGAAAAALYLLVGLAGVPVFAGGAAGLGVLAGPSAGFLLSYPFAALVVGFLARAGVRRGRGVAGLVAGTLLGGIGVVYAFGVPGMAWGGDLDLATAAKLCLGYLPGDLVKVVLAVLVAAPVHRAFPRLTAR